MSSQSSKLWGASACGREGHSPFGAAGGAPSLVSLHIFVCLDCDGHLVCMLVDRVFQDDCISCTSISEKTWYLWRYLCPWCMYMKKRILKIKKEQVRYCSVHFVQCDIKKKLCSFLFSRSNKKLTNHWMEERLASNWLRSLTLKHGIMTISDVKKDNNILFWTLCPSLRGWSSYFTFSVFVQLFGSLFISVLCLTLSRQDS